MPKFQVRALMIFSTNNPKKYTPRPLIPKKENEMEILMFASMKKKSG